jgi:hypothetical protein
VPLWGRRKFRCYQCGHTQEQAYVLIRVRRIVLCDESLQKCVAGIERHRTESEWQSWRHFAP